MNSRPATLRVALAHDWLTGMRGGEAVLEYICRRYPRAPLVTLFHHPGSVSSAIEARPIYPSGLDRIPGARARYRHLLPLFPSAVEGLRIPEVDLVVSTSHCAIKGLRLPEHVEHVCYVHTPMRYVYDQFDHYFGPGRAGWPVRLAMRGLRPYLREWDRRTATRPTQLVANSRHVRDRISRYWGREAEVIYPPVRLDRFAPAPTPTRDYFLVVGAMAPYKRVDLAIEACAALGMPLWIAGEGQDARRLQRRAGGMVRLLGRVVDDALPRLYANARALLFPGEEDFGIIPVEALASGTPVIAFGRGGATETVRGLDHDLPTGVLFVRQTTAALIQAIQDFEMSRERFSQGQLVQSAARFSAPRFEEAFGAVLERAEASVRARFSSSRP